MIDGIKIENVSVSADALLTNDRLTFALPVDERTGAVLTGQTRRATDRGLTFELIPRLYDNGYRVELTGSLHQFYNDGRHNADQFTVANLLATLDQLLTTYGINPATARLNNVEFGVNVLLPFRVAQVLNNLASYKNRPFKRVREPGNGYAYYQAETQRYVVKLYDKGDQYGLGDNLLRVEVKVLKMEYLKENSIDLNTLSDLLTVANYERLGALLVKTFTKIVFDDPAVDRAKLTARERSIYQNGRNPRFWHIPDYLTKKQRKTYNKRLERAERKYRALLDRYGAGNWQHQTATLIGQTWERLTTTDDQLLTQINERRAAWQHMEKSNFDNLSDSPNNCVTTVLNGIKCRKLTDPQKPELSQINPLYVVLEGDTLPATTNTTPGPVVCAVTGVELPTTSTGGRVRRFVSASMLRNDDDLMLTLQNQFKQYAKGSKEDEFSRAAHNVRNRHSNERNNLRRSINRINRQPTLFDVSGTLRLTPDQRAALDHWQGTRYEVRAGPRRAGPR